MKQLLIILVVGISLTSTTYAENFSSLKPLNSAAKSFNFSYSKIYTYFWATWCGVCKKKIKHNFPHLKLKKGEALILVATDYQQGRVRKYIKKYKINYPVFVDISRAMINQLKVKSVPAWAIWKRQNKSFILSSFSVGKLRQNHKKNKE